MSEFFSEGRISKWCISSMTELFDVSVNEMTFPFFFIFDFCPGCSIVVRHFDMHEFAPFKGIWLEVSPYLSSHLAP
jgi:hypothetical protein